MTARARDRLVKTLLPTRRLVRELEEKLKRAHNASVEEAVKLVREHENALADYLSLRLYLSAIAFPGVVKVPRKEISGLIRVVGFSDVPNAWRTSNPFEFFFRHNNRHRLEWNRLKSILAEHAFYQQAIDQISFQIRTALSRIVNEGEVFATRIAAQIEKSGKPNPMQVRFYLGSAIKAFGVKSELFLRISVLAKQVKRVAHNEGFSRDFVSYLERFEKETLEARQRSIAGAQKWQGYLKMFEPKTGQ